ncbi:MAG TPA: acetolactate decarboxylase [bacterium]|nr:acetolactate decarboxylase [bacterium]
MIRRVLTFCFAAAMAASFAGCAAPAHNGITQVATIDALMAGVYDGHMPLETLRKYGDLGVGTFEGLDGEMVLLDGSFYQVRADGKVYRPALAVRTPFACVTDFAADRREELTAPIDRTALEAKIGALVPQRNRFCAFVLRGEFRSVRTRSVPAQKKPYPPLVEVTKHQPVFDLANVRGTVIGFRSPEFVKGVNVPGYHMHFLADDLSGGGHLLEFEMTRGTLEADTVHEWLHVYLPQSAAFGSADLAKDRSADVHAAENDAGAKPPAAVPAQQGGYR